MTDGLETQNKAVKELKETKCKGIKELSDADYEPIYKAFESRVGPYEKLQHEAIKKFNADQKDEVLKNLPNLMKAIAEADIFDKKEWMGIMVDLSKPILSNLYEAEGKEAASLLGFDGFRMTPEARRAIDRSMELMAESYNDTTLGLLKDFLQEGQTEGWTLDELTEKLNSVYDYSDEVRARQVAQTETFRIANDSTKEAWKQSGVVKTIKWYTAADERVCEWCDAMHGKTIDIDDTFFDKGDNAIGTDGSKLPITYDDVGSPPLHVSCRCYTRPEDISLE